MAIRAAVLTSTAPRHLYFLQVLSGAFDIATGLTQPKRAYYAAQRENSAAVRAHFAALAEAEHAEFSSRLNGGAAKMREVADINDPALVEEITATGAEVVFLFGTEILAPYWLDAFPERIINLHLGLSPYYRGSATLFWPCANGEPECVGATIHLAVQKVDAGALLARIKIDPEIGDSYYSLTNRMIGALSTPFRKSRAIISPAGSHQRPRPEQRCGLIARRISTTRHWRVCWPSLGRG